MEDDTVTIRGCCFFCFPPAVFQFRGLTERYRQSADSETWEQQALRADRGSELKLEGEGVIDVVSATASIAVSLRARYSPRLIGR